jgi:hypothetical protein
MKSVTIKDMYGKILFKVEEKKGGKYDLIIYKGRENTVTYDIRDNKNCKVRFN